MSNQVLQQRPGSSNGQGRRSHPSDSGAKLEPRWTRLEKMCCVNSTGALAGANWQGDPWNATAVAAVVAAAASTSGRAGLLLWSKCCWNAGGTTVTRSKPWLPCGGLPSAASLGVPAHLFIRLGGLQRGALCTGEDMWPHLCSQCTGAHSAPHTSSLVDSSHVSRIDRGNTLARRVGEGDSSPDSQQKAQTCVKLYHAENAHNRGWTEALEAVSRPMSFLARVAKPYQAPAPDSAGRFSE